MRDCVQCYASDAARAATDWREATHEGGGQGKRPRCYGTLTLKKHEPAALLRGIELTLMPSSTAARSDAHDPISRLWNAAPESPPQGTDGQCGGRC